MKAFALLAVVGVAALAGCAVRASVPGASFAVDSRQRVRHGHYSRDDYRRERFGRSPYGPRFVRRDRCDDGY